MTNTEEMAVSSLPADQVTDCPPDACIHSLLKAQAERRPEAIAITAPGRAALTYGHLHAHVEEVVAALNALGVGRNDRVALVLPNGPEIAVAFVSVASAATCAPLNPAYRANELEFYLSDLEAKALVVQAGLDSPARDVADTLGIPVLELVPEGQAEAGLFTLKGEGGRPAAHPGCARPDDVALALHTSGTTSRPKLVPLTHANLWASARNIQATLQLDERDRCLVVMPLFHIHGLIAATLSSLLAGASVVCPPGFYAPQFFDWLEEFRPTWYTAVPTMHQAILARAAAKQEIIARCPLRFIRSSSSALPPQLLAELEKVFRVPVIEAYGMTEASHQMASNPLPPQKRKPGSVGRAAGPEIAIMDEAGRLLPAGQTGEVVIRGANVTLGYEKNPTANHNAFTDGWFRTGDQGYLDEEGYLFLTGRIKELINRGGEKISPREVDEVLLDHPAVAQAVTFAAPHAQLGEEVAAAVVLREKAAATEKELREFAATRLADFKVPRRLLILEEIPKGPTGKLQRLGLADKLGLTLTEPGPLEVPAAFTAPQTPTEEALAQIWVRILRIERIGVHDDFFRLGGDSVLATALVAQVEKTFGRSLPMVTVMQQPTIAQLARVIDQPAPAWSSLVELQAGSKPAFFCVHGLCGEVNSFFWLARHLGPDQPFYGIRARRGKKGPQAEAVQIETMAANYLEEVRALQPEGPYFLGGFYLGGTVAFEMAQQLRAQGQKVRLVAIMENQAPHAGNGRALWKVATAARFVHNSYYWALDELFQSSFKEVWARARVKAKSVKNRVAKLFQSRQSGQGGAAESTDMFYIPNLTGEEREVVQNHYRAYLNYRPKVYPGTVSLFRARAQPLLRPGGRDLGWGKFAAGVDVTVVPGFHENILREPHVQVLAARLKERMQQAEAMQESTTPGQSLAQEVSASWA